MSAKILSFDIETAPAIVHAWARFKQNINEAQIIQEGYILSWAAKWLDDETVYWDSQFEYKEDFKKDPTDDTNVVLSLAEMLDEADIVVAHNGDKFDIAWLNTQLIKHGLDPINPVKSVDTYKVCRGQFRFPSNRLESVAKYLDLNVKKGNPGGWPTWIGCMHGDKTCWDRMIEYNIGDVRTLEELYLRLRPFIKNHPNVGIYGELEDEVCPACGSDNLAAYKGYYYTNLSKFRRLQCNDCGKKNIRGRKNLLTKEQRESLVTNGV